jgi:hypothetical protein
MYKIALCFLCLGAFFTGGCCNCLKKNDKAQSDSFAPTAKAFYTASRISVDGKLSENVWQRAEKYYLDLSQDKLAAGQELSRGGYVQFAWDENNFYLAAEFKDYDIVAEGKADQLHHYRMGDLCELFIKPKNHRHYWELYVTPLGYKTEFFFPSPGYKGLPSCFEDYTANLRTDALINGTVNNYNDRDSEWTAEMAVPISDLEAYGAKFGPCYEWSVFAGRYNYSYYLDDPELSMFPSLATTSYHLTEQYADLELVGKQ